MVKPHGRLALVLPVTALFGESWRGIRQMLSSKYEVEFVVSSHDPGLRSLSYDTSIAETLVVARRLRENESPSRRGVFVNLRHAAYRETDALAIINAVNAAVSTPVHGSDGPPVGGSPVMVGGEQWGEIMHGPLGAESWKTARWRNGATAQFAAALERGELWAADGTRAVARIPVAAMRDVCSMWAPTSQNPRLSRSVRRVSRMGWASTVPCTLEPQLVGSSRPVSSTKRKASTQTRPRIRANLVSVRQPSYDM